MRISDWSSDVCSSDLYSTKWRSAAASPDSLSDRPGNLPRGLCIRARPIKARAMSRPPTCTASKSGRTPVAASQAPVQVQPRKKLLLPLASRSEEHTSELQSLMRISYAVFCLKKKKITTNKKTSIKNKKQDNN